MYIEQQILKKSKINDRKSPFHQLIIHANISYHHSLRKDY